MASFVQFAGRRITLTMRATQISTLRGSPMPGPIRFDPKQLLEDVVADCVDSAIFAV